MNQKQGENNIYKQIQEGNKENNAKRQANKKIDISDKKEARKNKQEKSENVLFY